MKRRTVATCEYAWILRVVGIHVPSAKYTGEKYVDGNADPEIPLAKYVDPKYVVGNTKDVNIAHALRCLTHRSV